MRWICGLVICSLPFVSAYGASGTELKQENIAALKAMSPSDREALDKQLAEALQYYYVKDYQNALPIFREIADKVETLDLMFWIGTSAANAGQYQLAMDKFKNMLSMDPDLYRVRLEYADALYKSGRLRDARNELELVKASSPPAGVIRNIERRLNLIGAKSVKTRWGLNLSTGYQYDDNVSSGPDSTEIVLATGTLRLANNEQETSGYNWLVKAGGNLLHDTGDPGGWIWSGKLDLYNSENDEFSNLDFRSTDLTTGPLRAGKRVVFRLPVGYRNTRYGNEDLSDTVHVDPSLKFTVNENLNWQFSYGWSDEEYAQRIYSGNDNTLQKASIGANFYLAEGKHAISAKVSYEDRDAVSDTFSYQGASFELTYFSRISDRTDVFLKYKRSEQDYSAPPPLYAKDREDSRDTVTVAVSHRFLQKYFVSFGYVYMNNDSNAALYTFDKNMVTLDFGISF